MKGERLKEIDIPESVTSIGNEAFFGCSLTALELPSGLTSLGNGAFRGNSFTEITIPESIDEIYCQTDRYALSLIIKKARLSGGLFLSEIMAVPAPVRRGKIADVNPVFGDIQLRIENLTDFGGHCIIGGC